MEMYTDLFNKMSSACFAKCASHKHKDTDLALGEMSCTDRCVAKYLEAQEKVGVVLQKANEMQAKQAQAMADMQAAMGGRWMIVGLDGKCKLKYLSNIQI